MLIGAMIPLAVGHFVRRNETVGSAVGEMLFIALAGAGVACLVCATVLFSYLGERASLDLAAAIHAVVALGALAMHRRVRREPVLPAELPFWRQAQLPFRPMLALAAAAGLLSLSYALFFVRILSYAASSKEVVLTATLGGFLIGLAVGARRAATHCALFSAEEVMRRAARSAMAANLIGLAVLPLLAQFAWLDRALIVLAMLLGFLAARACGALVPYLAELSIPADARAGLRYALINLASIAGAAAAMLVTGVWLADRLSLIAMGVTLVVTGAMMTVVLAAILDLPRWQKIVRGVTAVAVAVLALTLVPLLSTDVAERLSAQGPSKPLVQTIQKRAPTPRGETLAQRATD
jgi:hypothetical protein